MTSVNSSRNIHLINELVMQFETQYQIKITRSEVSVFSNRLNGLVTCILAGIYIYISPIIY